MTAATFSQAIRIDPEPFVRRERQGTSRLELAVKGMRCAECMAKIERGVSALPGVEEARVNLSSAKCFYYLQKGIVMNKYSGKTMQRIKADIENAPKMESIPSVQVPDSLNQ